MEKYILGLDVGIASVGWGLIKVDDDNKPQRIVDLGVRIFEAGEEPKTGESLNLNRREKRGIRRIIRRRSHRLDRIRDLLYQNNLLNTSIDESIYSDYLSKLRTETRKLIDKYYEGKSSNPFTLKVKALDEKLTPIELSIILLHYAKNRGYKSNRADVVIDNKTDEINKSDSAKDNKVKESKKVLSSIMENEALLSKYRTVSEMLIIDDKFSARIHNGNDDYKTCISREMYENEISKVLDRQIEFKLIDENFKNEYLKIWSSQRDFSEGPGGESRYGGNLIERMTGTCPFTEEPRAPKCAPSVELFSVLQKLVNFRYYDKNNEVTSLTKEQIQLIIDKLLLENKVSYTYKQLEKILGIDNFRPKDLSMSRKDYGKLCQEFKTKILNLNKEEKFILESCNYEQRNAFEKMKEEKLLSKTFIQMKTYAEIKDAFCKQFGLELWTQEKDNFKMFDTIVTILTNYKTNDKIKAKIEENNDDKNNPFINPKYIDFILSLSNYKDHVSLSLSLIYKLNTLLKNGYRYDQAMREINYNHSDLLGNFEKNDYLRAVTIASNIKNGRVIRALTQTRKVINAIVYKYGLPVQINVEVARELARTKKERKEIEEAQLENKNKNDSIKKEIYKKFSDMFKSIDSISSIDLLKYKLWVEQEERCTYSLEHISIDELFRDNQTQIDHILPYSRTYDDSYLNKTLVKTKANQDKGNRTPYEWLGRTTKWRDYETNILNSINISSRKKEYYLNKKLGEEEQREFKQRNLVDTQNIATILANILKRDINVPKIKMINGTITGKLRSRWGLNGLTHSFESPSYYIKNVKDNDDSQMEKKNRDNNLHHALDACVIAATDDSLIQKITRYEKYKRYLEGLIKKYKNIDELSESITYYNDKTGEVLAEGKDDTEIKQNIIELKDYVKEALSEKFIINDPKRGVKTYIPTPYKEFREEVKMRTYEQNPEVLKMHLQGLENYSKDDINSANPIIPSIAKTKIGGSLHKETYYGIREKEIENSVKKVIIERMNVNSKRFTKEKLESIVDKDKGSKQVYESIKNWLGNCENGEVAFKKQDNHFPVNDKTHNLIKKIRVESGEFVNKGHLLDNRKMVEIDTIQKIQVFKKDKDDKLYFLGLDLMTMNKIKKNSENTIVTIWSGQGKNNSTLTYKNLIENYIFEQELSKNDYIKVTLRDGREGKDDKEGYCYVNGFSSGKLEVKSALGDGFDIIGEHSLFSKQLSQYYLTVSTIKSIAKVQIDILGKVPKKVVATVFR